MARSLASLGLVVGLMLGGCVHATGSSGREVADGRVSMEGQVSRVEHESPRDLLADGQRGRCGGSFAQSARGEAAGARGTRR